MVLDGPEVDAGIAGGRGADEIVERHPVHPGDGQQDLEVRAPSPGFQTRQRAHGDAGCRGHVTEREVPLLCFQADGIKAPPRR